MTLQPEPPHVLIYEPRVEGHHLVWLRYFVEDLLGASSRLTLAVDQRPAAADQIRQHLGGLLAKVTVLPLHDGKGRPMAPSHLANLEACWRRTRANSVFLASLDEIASICFRRAAFGMLPPATLRGRLGGVYFRPRMLQNDWSPNQILKRAGLRRLLRERWFQQILLCDEYLLAAQQTRHPDAPLFFLPDPFPDGFAAAQTEARQALDLPLNKAIFLFYGGPYRRKGLSLAVTAMLDLPVDCNAFLLCVGERPQEDTLVGQLTGLAARGKARNITRRVTDTEERLVFAACDFVLLPYRRHFGSSGVLANAAGAGRIVIASDEELIGRRVREHGLGFLFSSGCSRELRAAMEAALRLSAAERAAFSSALARFAAGCTRAHFRQALLRSFGIAPTAPSAR